MKPNASLAMLCLLLAATSTPLLAQTPDSIRYDRDSTFWARFEQEVDKFVTNALNGFSNAEEEPPSEVVMDTVHTWASDSSSVQDYGWTDRHRPRRFIHYGIPARASWLDENTIQKQFMLRYNRVEGLFIGLGSEKKYYWETGREFNPFGSVGYGFRSHRWRYNLGVARQFPIGFSDTDQLLEVGVEGYSLTDSKDQWRISTHENTMAAFFIHEDFRDYFGKDGATLHAAYLLRDGDLFGEARVGYVVDRYRSLDNRAEWALFGGSKLFRENPGINNGMMRSVLALAGFSTASRSRYGTEGWNVHATAEFAGAGLGGDFRFQQYIVDLRRYQPLGRHDNINVRFRAGTSHGTLPIQKTFELGGLGSMPAYRFKEFPGDSLGANRMLLMNAEYILNGDFLSDLSFWPSWLLKHVNLIFLADAGIVRSASSRTSPFSGFEGITWNEFRSDAGVGIGNRSGSFRLAAVWRTDRSEPARLLLRVEAPF